MEADKPSMTAVMMAALRAHHYACPEPRIFADAFAQALLSPSESEMFVRANVQLLGFLDAALAASCSDQAAVLYHALRAGPGVGPLVRARYIEESLLAALAGEVRQYVIIGAGLDTFAFRRPELMQDLRVIEIDHPATQALKRERLRLAGLVPPANLHFAAANLECEDVSDVLARTAYDRTFPAFFAWPGVTMYLTRNAIFKTLSSIASVAARGSRLVFDYIEPAAFGADAPRRVQFVIRRAQQLGEPMTPGLTPATLRSDLARLSLQLVDDWGPAEIQTRLLSGIPGFQAVEHWRFVQALVGSDAKISDSGAQAGRGR